MLLIFDLEGTLYNSRTMTLFEGTESVIKKLSENNTITLCTNVRKKSAEELLSEFCILQYFSDIKAFDTGQSKEERIKDLLIEFQVKDAVMIGDSFYDIHSAKKAGVKSIGVTYSRGYSEVREADYTVKDINEIIEIVKKLDN